MKKLSNNELQTILLFIQKRGFCYIDVQTKLLDHVASRVEEIQDEDPNISLDLAIQKSHTEFGAFGFSAIEDAIMNGLTKKYNRFFCKTFLSFFGPKHILLVLFAGYSMYKFQSVVNSRTCMYLTMGTIFLTAIVCLFKLYRPEYKHYLTYRVSTMYFIGFGSFWYLMILVIKEIDHLVVLGFNPGPFAFSALLTVFVLYFIAAIRTARVGLGASELLQEKYKLI